MIRLLRANFARLWKTRSFWICTVILVAISAAGVVSGYMMRPISVEYMGSGMLSNATSAALFTAVTVSLYLGTDYSNGTVRNRLVIGRTRIEIYFANLMTTVSVGIMQFGAACAVAYAAGAFFGGKLGMPAGEFALKTAVCICALTALCALLTVIGMLCCSKSMTVTITLVSIFALMVTGIMIMQRLAEPEFVTGAAIDEDGNLQIGGQEENPMYVSGVQRDILIAVNDILPTGQLIQVEAGTPGSVKLMPLYSFGVAAVSTAAGAVVFRKKDLK